MQLKNMYKKKTKYIRGSSQMNETEITKEGSIILLNKSIKAVVEFLPEEMQEESVRKLGGWMTRHKTSGSEKRGSKVWLS